MRISFLVPTFNRADFLSEALESILQQCSAEDEVLVIDDGSTDGTAQVAQSFGSRIGYHRQENAGKARALNRGLAMTSGEYVWICDDDDILRPDAVDTMIGALAGNSAGFAFGRYSRFEDREGQGRVDIGTGYWPRLESGALARHILDDAFVMHNASIVRRTAYDAVGPFSEAMPRSLDYEMFVRLACSQPAIYVDRIIFDQRKHPGARGPSAILHAAKDSEKVWDRFDQQIFVNLYRHVPLAFFAGFFAGGADDRPALLLRASIMGRHNCWNEALADLEAASALGAAPLAPVEQRTCQRALSGKNLFTSLLSDPRLVARFRKLAHTVAGARIRQHVMLGARWRIRYATPPDRKATLQLLAKLGWSAIPGFVSGKESALDGPDASLREKDVISAECLLPPGLLPPVGAA